MYSTVYVYRVDLARCLQLALSATDMLMLLMQEVPGRLWDGKEVVLEAIGELITIEPHCVQPEEDVITTLLGAAAAPDLSVV